MADVLAPGALDPAAVAAGLGTAVVGREVRSYRQVGSTMDLAREAAQEGAPDGLVIVADEQTAGRGRLNRQWIAPPGSSLLTTILLRPSIEVAQKLTVIASLAVCEAIEEATGLSVRLKWPNDALINGKKVCGILIETDSQDGHFVALVGIGLNVNFDPANLTDAVYPPTTLSHELGSEVDRLPLLRALLRHFDRLLAAAQNGVPVHEQWQRRLTTPGLRVRVTMSDGTVEEGVAEGVGPNGELLVRRADGSLATVVAGDVTLR